MSGTQPVRQPYFTDAEKSDEMEEPTLAGLLIRGAASHHMNGILHQTINPRGL